MQIKTDVKDGKVFIEMGEDSIQAYFYLLQSALSTITDKLERVDENNLNNNDREQLDLLVEDMEEIDSILCDIEGRIENSDAQMEFYMN